MGRSRSLDTLAQALRFSFPHVGPRQSERMALKLLSIEEKDFLRLIESMRQARSRVIRCEHCQDLTEAVRCPICSSPSRQRSVLCVVENPQDVDAIEASGSYRGLYHVLHGSLDARMEEVSTSGKTPLTLKALWLRLEEDAQLGEIILALDQDTSGELTSLYLVREIQKNFPCLRITRIGVGIPFGGEVQYGDPATLKQALAARMEISVKPVTGEKSSVIGA
ncbi:MAG: recombination protein RecR [Elusimicrobia bacterium]|nr:recombination protein RecR [Elusimicrobiota bacterium]